MHTGTISSITPRPRGIGSSRSHGRESPLIRTTVFVDGQNLFRLALDSWGKPRTSETFRYSWPSYDVVKLAAALVRCVPNRTLTEIRFYTGVPSGRSNQRWIKFWRNKLVKLRHQGVHTFRGIVDRYGNEKGVDVCLAIDLVHAAHEQSFDVAIIVSQDSDFEPAVDLVKEVAGTQGRKVIIESAFPAMKEPRRNRGINGTKWGPIDKSMYDSCFDPEDYF